MFTILEQAEGSMDMSAFTDVGPGSIPGQGSKIPQAHVVQPKKKNLNGRKNSVL